MIFTNPAFLWGLLALLIPIAVHLFNFRRYRKVYFSNVDRLSELHSENRRHSTLRRWMVLLARLIALAALVLAFAQPTLPGNGQQPRPGGSAVSVFVDNSFSMENAGSDGSQLEEAKRKAREIVAAYRPGDRFQLISNTLSGEEFRWLSREEFLDALDALQTSPSSHTIGDIALRQAEFMRQSGSSNRHAYLVSDFQQSIFNPDELPADTLVLFTLVPLQGTDADNLYIDTIRLDAPAYFTGGRVSVEATLHNSSSHDVEKLPVRLFIAGRERAMSTVDIPAGTSAKTQLQFTIDSAGWLDGYVEITDYPVTFDDSYHFTLLAGKPVAMLEVDGSNPNISLRKLFSTDSTIHFQTAPLPSDLSPYNVIVLNEVLAMPSGQAQALATWVEAGGALVIIPPVKASTEQLNGLLSLMQAPTLNQWIPQQARATNVDFGNSLYRGVFNATNDEMEMPSVQGRYSLTTAKAIHQAVITLADGSPLLTATPHGTGRIYLFAMPLTTDWTDLVNQALFVPTLYNMALYSRPLPPPCYTLGCTEPIFLQGIYDHTATPPELLFPDGQTTLLPDLRRLGNRTVLIPHGDLTAAGIYTLADEHLAFNYDRLESRLEYYTPSEVESLLDNRQGYSTVTNAAKPLDQFIRNRENGTPLWRWCILTALAALLAETLLLRPWRNKNNTKD